MTPPEPTGSALTPDNRNRHLLALLAGLVALFLFFTLPAGVVGYATLIMIGTVAVTFGHRAARRRGPLRWAAILGLVLSYLELLTAIGLLTVRLTRVFSG